MQLNIKSARRGQVGAGAGASKAGTMGCRECTTATVQGSGEGDATLLSQ